MKVLQFTIPVPHDKSVIADQFSLPYFYPYLHRHKETQITWIQKGEGTLIAGNNMHHFAPGDVFLLGANLPHLFKSDPQYFENENEDAISALSIFFNPDGILASFFDLPEVRAHKLFIQQHQQGIKVPEANTVKIINAMAGLRDSSGADQLIQFIQLLKGLSDINEQLQPLSSYGNLPGITENEGIRIGNIYNYIMQNYTEAITLDDVAKAAFMTSESFCRYFKKHTGNTFVTFLNEVRINEACKMLTANKFESISIVAYKSGFKSITNFNRVFRSVTGSSPREYTESFNGKIATSTGATEMDGLKKGNLKAAFAEEI
ncbi:AraC family transcriptional regulator [Mucilaginibacter flavus]|uniref:AraC family transcriptional regulator n=1 Tax=Mucilaginibacter flavus TaxID=931504 RepID=UPI0025B3B85C|nr:AraC family transcriptional regulator [Mucilaginibacter flavus]MDN3582566.1 AraC family transcriptional regulator [Mucilaginibacter flavus]